MQLIITYQLVILCYCALGHDLFVVAWYRSSIIFCCLTEFAFESYELGTWYVLFLPWLTGRFLLNFELDSSLQFDWCHSCPGKLVQLVSTYGFVAGKTAVTRMDLFVCAQANPFRLAVTFACVIMQKKIILLFSDCKLVFIDWSAYGIGSICNFAFEALLSHKTQPFLSSSLASRPVYVCLKSFD